MNFSKIKENALKYLGYHHQILDEKMNVLIDECIEEIEKMSSFRVTYRKFPLSFQSHKNSCYDKKLLTLKTIIKIRDIVFFKQKKWGPHTHVYEPHNSNYLILLN